jgi:hypothetical protein
MMVNGKILCVASPAAFVDSHGNPVFGSPTSFFEYDPMVGATGAFTQSSSPVGGLTDNIYTYQSAMLALPDGTILYCHVHEADLFYNGFGAQLYVYRPDGTPLASGKPAITSLARNADGSLHLIGTQFNGISSGASYGDDAQMDSNYPLVRLTDSIGGVIYARTHDWSSTGVQTGSTPVSTEATLPGNLFPGRYSLAVVANGISSDPVVFDEPVWVDFNFTFPLQFGTFTFPYRTLAQGVGAVASGGAITLKPGVSSETMSISKPMTILAFGGTATIGR